MVIIAGAVALDTETGSLYTENNAIRERIEFVFAENKRYRDALKIIRNRGIMCDVCPKDCDCPHCIAKYALDIGRMK